MENDILDAINKETREKILTLLKYRQITPIANVKFDSNLILAPMAGITTHAYRILMENLGAGATVTELISAHAVNHKNFKTIQMLTPNFREKNLAIQIFGEDATSVAKACNFVQKFTPQSIDINIGCPVKKVVSRGAGSALLQDLKKLKNYLLEIRRAVVIPLSIKIRTGWDESTINAMETVKIAEDCGIDFVSIHGRTRSQQYSGQVNWDYIESIAQNSSIPIIGNGDLHSPKLVKERMIKTKCDALMLGRGSIRNPFIFLESIDPKGDIKFNSSDIWEVINVLFKLNSEMIPKEKIIINQTVKHIVWLAAGYSNSKEFRNKIYKVENINEARSMARDFFLAKKDSIRKLNYDSPFMGGGHG